MKGSGFIEIDVHGMNRFQAKTYIDSVLKKAGKDVYRIDIVHGYRSGSSLKEMVRNDLPLFAMMLWIAILMYS